MLQKTKYLFGLHCWIVDFVFPFALGYIDINFSYASPACRLCVFVKESMCVCAGARARQNSNESCQHGERPPAETLADRAG